MLEKQIKIDAEVQVSERLQYLHLHEIRRCISFHSMFIWLIDMITITLTIDIITVVMATIDLPLFLRTAYN